MQRYPFYLIVLIFLYSCNNENQNKTIEDYKAEIIEVETDFAKMAQEEGIQTAFLFFAADNAVLNRDDGLINGKEAIKAHFEMQNLKDVKLAWSPDFVDVAVSGDLAYTYGHYTYSAIDKKGEIIKSEGIFHTVWKRQADGKWRFVWD